MEPESPSPLASHQAHPLSAHQGRNKVPHSVETTAPLITSTASRSLSASPRRSVQPSNSDHSFTRTSVIDDLSAVATKPSVQEAASRADNLKDTIIQEKNYIFQATEQYKQQLTRLKTMKVWQRVLAGVGIAAAIAATVATLIIVPPLGIIAFSGGVLLTLGMAKIGNILTSQKPEMSKGDIGRAEQRYETLNQALDLFEKFPLDKKNPSETSFEEFLEKNANHVKDEQTGLETYEYRDLETCVTIFRNVALNIPEKKEVISTLKIEIERLEKENENNIHIAKAKESLLKEEIALKKMIADVHDAELLREGKYPGKKLLGNVEKFSWGESTHIGLIPQVEFPLISSTSAICFFGNEARIPNSYINDGNLTPHNAAILKARGYDSTYDFLSINAPRLRPIVIDGKGYRTITHYLLQQKLDKKNEGLTPKSPGYINPEALNEVSREIHKKKTGQEAIEAYTAMMPMFYDDEIFKGMDEDLKIGLFHKFINPDGTISSDGWALLDTGTALLIAGHETGDKSYGARMSSSESKAEKGVLKGENKLGRYLMDFRDFLQKYQSEPDGMIRSAFQDDMNHRKISAAAAAKKAETYCKSAGEIKGAVEKTIETAHKWVKAMSRNTDKEKGTVWNQRFRIIVDGAKNDIKKIGEKLAEALKTLDECNKTIQQMSLAYDDINSTPYALSTTNILNSALEARNRAKNSVEVLYGALNLMSEEVKLLEKAATVSEDRFADHAKIFQESCKVLMTSSQQFSEHLTKAKELKNRVQAYARNHGILISESKASLAEGNRDDAKRLGEKGETYRQNKVRCAAEMKKERDAAEKILKEMEEAIVLAGRMQEILERNSLPHQKNLYLSLKRKTADAKTGLAELDNAIKSMVSASQ